MSYRFIQAGEILTAAHQGKLPAILKFLVVDEMDKPLVNFNINGTFYDWVPDAAAQVKEVSTSTSSKSDEHGMVIISVPKCVRLLIEVPRDEIYGKYMISPEFNAFRMSSADKSAAVENDLSKVPAGVNFIFKVKKLKPIKRTLRSSLKKFQFHIFPNRFKQPSSLMTFL